MVNSSCEPDAAGTMSSWRGAGEPAATAGGSDGVLTKSTRVVCTSGGDFQSGSGIAVSTEAAMEHRPAETGEGLHHQVPPFQRPVRYGRLGWGD